MIAIILLIGIIYSVPNFFPAEPAVQLNSKVDQPVDPATLQKIEQALQAKGLAFRSSETQGTQALIRFSDTDTQLKASEALKEAVGNQFTIALNLAPSTPSFLRALHANPM